MRKLAVRWSLGNTATETLPQPLMVYKAPDDEIGAPTCIAGSSAQCGKQGSAPAVLLALVATGLLAAVAATATAAAATAAAVSKAAAVAAPDPYHIFPRQFIDAPVSTGELRNASCVTVFGHTDGFGAQFSSLMSGWATALLAV